MKNLEKGNLVKVNKGDLEGFVGVVKATETYSRLADSFWDTGVRTYEQFQWVNLEGLEHVWFGEGMVDKL